MKEKILIVEDEKDIVRVLEYNLKKEGYRIISTHNGEEALELASGQLPGLVILDLMLPGIDGLEVCKALKKDSKTARIPVIMLTAKSQESDKVIGLELGADDYLAKPFGIRELLARVKAVLRRAKENSTAVEAQDLGGLSIDFLKIEVCVNGKAVELTSKEFELLKALINAKGRVLSRDYLLDNIWGFDHAMEIQTRTVDAHVRSLRKKLKGQSKRIVTVKKYGYKFEEDL